MRIHILAVPESEILVTGKGNKSEHEDREKNTVDPDEEHNGNDQGYPGQGSFLKVGHGRTNAPSV